VPRAEHPPHASRGEGLQQLKGAQRVRERGHVLDSTGSPGEAGASPGGSARPAPRLQRGPPNVKQGLGEV
jgi:hypothetical protein